MSVSETEGASKGACGPSSSTVCSALLGGSSGSQERSPRPRCWVPFYCAALRDAEQLLCWQFSPWIKALVGARGGNLGILVGG